jgi:hypothetical protein
MVEGQVKLDDGERDVSDMAKETVRTLDTLNLTRWFTVSQYVVLDKDKY